MINQNEIEFCLFYFCFSFISFLIKSNVYSNKIRAKKNKREWKEWANLDIIKLIIIYSWKLRWNLLKNSFKCRNMMGIKTNENFSFYFRRALTFLLAFSCCYIFCLHNSKQLIKNKLPFYSNKQDCYQINDYFVRKFTK